MPPAKPTSANDHRPLHVDLRAKVIGTNVLLDRLTQEVTRLVEAQTKLTATLGELLAKQAHPLIYAPVPPEGSLAAGLARSNPRQVEQPLDPEWDAYSEAQRLQHIDTAAVPYGTEPVTNWAALDATHWPRAMTRDEVLADNAQAAADDAIARSQNARSQAERVLLMDGQPPNDLIVRQRSAYIDDESPPPSSLAAQMAQELAEESAWDAEDPEPAPPPPPDNHALWQRRMSSWRGSRLWMPEWGPRPGQEGCKAPANMLNGRR